MAGIEKMEEKDFIPRIDHMSVSRYDINAKVFPMMCVVENRLNFKPNGENGAGTISKFAYPLHGKAKMNKFIAHIVPMAAGLTEGERKDKTIIVEVSFVRIRNVCVV